ncbi:MAG: thioredoxin family protein, partial [Bacteroidales bacterium]|nr:thioredoxin family protein [Bacteroidales bacterium]
MTLDARLDEYLAVLEREPIDVKCSEVDFIISACTDSTVMARVANKVYNHYVDSKLMGDEAVAIHVFDTWFADKKIGMGSDDAWFAAQFFATANRNSLIGCPAPPLTLYTPDNAGLTIFDNVPDRYTVLYFYDTDCSKCLVESIKLRAMLERRDYAVDLCAIYVGSNEESWAQYRAARLDVDSPNLRVIHLWDPDLSSGFTLQYGVIGTPKMFLVDPSGTIVGRGLDTSSLEQLLDTVLTPQTLEYGSDESKALYDKTFADTAPTDCEAVSQVAAHIQSLLFPAVSEASDTDSDETAASVTSIPRGDTLLFKQMTGDLLYYLTSRKEAQFKCGAPAFIDDYI